MSDKPVDVDSPERPITDRKQDRLDRAAFVRRLGDALINPRTRRATGVVVGLTGSWGSGKSSVMNLLEADLRSRYPEAVLIRFDPWLVSGRNDLIAEFFAEAVAAINAQPSAPEKLKGLAEKLLRYGADLTPIAELFLPGAGTAKALMNRGAEALRRDDGLHAQRKRLLTELRELDVPIVVLIDELDRIDDREIHIVAQLVRAIADFPRISYLLAYDSERVIQALSDGAELERGRAYLEKIVQLQIPLPLSTEQEIAHLMRSDLQSLAAEGYLPENFHLESRFIAIEQVLIPAVISTVRDVRRLVGTFHVLSGLVGREVDWLDVLGYAALLIKSPNLVERIRRNPGLVVNDPAPHEAAAMRGWPMSSEGTHVDRLDALDPEPGVRLLLELLFPSLSGRRGDENRPTAIQWRRPLQEARRQRGDGLAAIASWPGRCPFRRRRTGLAASFVGSRHGAACES